MVATSHPLVSQVGLDILKDGGIAMDAAIGSNAALGLMERVSNGIGGDLFAIVWDPRSERLRGYNGSARSPLGLAKETIWQVLAIYSGVCGRLVPASWRIRESADGESAEARNRIRL
ncbi:MAG: gamma-glutamyltransferase [Verrucomicrobiota bacterium]|nr:gamma-glutamyltransferase [Verrucomicrobiota bacterium]